MTKRFYAWKTSNGYQMRRVFVFGNHSHSAAAFAALADEIRRDFPDAPAEAIDLGTVAQSDSIKGYALATWYVPEGVAVPPSYESWGDRFDFTW